MHRLLGLMQVGLTVNFKKAFFTIAAITTADGLLAGMCDHHTGLTVQARDADMHWYTDLGQIAASHYGSKACLKCSIEAHKAASCLVLSQAACKYPLPLGVQH